MSNQQSQYIPNEVGSEIDELALLSNQEDDDFFQNNPQCEFTYNLIEEFNNLSDIKKEEQRIKLTKNKVDNSVLIILQTFYEKKEDSALLNALVTKWNIPSECVKERLTMLYMIFYLSDVSIFVDSDSEITEHDHCWKFPFKHSCSLPLFKLVSDFMDVALVPYPGVSFSGSMISYYEVFQKSSVENNSLENNYTASHPPFLCELVSSCCGNLKRMKKHEKMKEVLKVEAKQESSEINSEHNKDISHCCIRPSHLVHLGIYGSRQLNYYPAENPIGCYLSNDKVMVPIHCLENNSEEEDIQYSEEELDFAIIRVSEQCSTCYPCKLNGDITLFAGINKWKVCELHIVNEFCAELELSEELQYGDSGMIVYGQGNITTLWPAENEIVYGKVPLFILIARNKDDNHKGLAVSLPYILNYIRLKDIQNPPYMPTNKPFQLELAKQFCDLYGSNWEQWEFIRERAKSKHVKNAYTKLSEKDKQEIYEQLSKNNFDASVIDRLTTFCNKNQTEQTNLNILNQLAIKQTAKQHRNITPENMRLDLVLLYKTYYIADLNVHYIKNPNTDQCWVLQFEREHLTSEGSYKSVYDFMEVCSLTNIDEPAAATAEEQNVTLYTGSSCSITMSKDCYDIFKQPLPRNSDSPKDNTAAHHPFLCELTDACRGVRTSPTNTRYITHCCIRPSHLVKLNKKFNDYCTILQDFYAIGNLKASWTKSNGNKRKLDCS